MIDEKTLLCPVGRTCHFIILPDSKDEERIKLNKKILTDE